MDFKNIEQTNNVARTYNVNNEKTVKSKSNSPERQSFDTATKAHANNKAEGVKVKNVEKRTQTSNENYDGTREITREPKKINEEIQKMVDELNDKLDSTDQTIKYEVHDKTNTIMVKIVNKETEEIIREVPKESDLDALADILEKAGMMFDEKR